MLITLLKGPINEDTQLSIEKYLMDKHLDNYLNKDNSNIDLNFDSITNDLFQLLLEVDSDPWICSADDCEYTRRVCFSSHANRPIVLDQQVQDPPRIRRPTVGTAYRRRARLGAKQMDRLCPRPS